MKLKYDFTFDVGIGRWSSYSVAYPKGMGYKHYAYVTTKIYSIPTGAWLFGLHDKIQIIEISNFALRVAKPIYIKYTSVELEMFHTHTIAMGANDIITLLYANTTYFAFETTKPNFYYILLK